MTFSVRVATVNDAADVAGLVQSAYRGEVSRAGWTTEADLLDGQRADAGMVRDLITAPRSVVLVADAPDGTVLACCHLMKDADDGGLAHLGMFAVRPGLQGRGTGRAMLGAAENFARDTWGTRTVALTVINHRLELIAWYERCGYSLTGATHPFPYGDERYGRPRRDDIVLLEMTRALA